MIGRPGPFSAATESSSLIATTSRSASAEAACRYRTWPAWRRSKQPFANAMVCPAARSAFTWATSSSRERTRPERLMVTRVRPSAGRRPSDRAAADGVAQFARADGCGAALHDDERARVVGEPRAFLERRPGTERQRERRDDRVAGARHVGDLVRPDNRDVDGLAARLEQRH